LAQYLSVKNKLISGDEDIFSWEDKEWLILYSKRKLETKHYNYLVFDTVIYLWKFLLVKIHM
jgi:UDP-2,3-diacylglucosamine hydrolase